MFMGILLLFVIHNNSLYMWVRYIWVRLDGNCRKKKGYTIMIKCLNKQISHTTSDEFGPSKKKKKKNSAAATVYSIKAKKKKI